MIRSCDGRDPSPYGVGVDTPRRRSLILVIATLSLGGAILIAVLVGRDTPTVPPDLASSQTKHHHPQRAPGVKVCEKRPRKSTLPAALLGRHVDPPGIHTDVLVTANAWSTGDCHTETWIYAGTAGWTNGTGVFVITRTKGEYHQLPTHYIVVPGSGATRITKAPLGPKVVTSAQHDGQFEFTSRRGIKGTLSLADDTVTLSSGEVIQARDKPYSRY
jgi:hypothetical protein